MIEVLFVDDEPRLLEALQVALHGQRRRWRMHFAPGGAEALAVLRAQRLDVVVTDMRMPRVDGAEVLAEARALQPWAGRVVLSGYAERDSALKVMPVAHQFLAKPCELGTLVGVVERITALQREVASPAVQEAVGRLSTLPSLPRTFQQVVAAISGRSAGAADLARAIERDVAMCCKVLQIVNSAFCGLPRTVASVEEAIVYLGFDLVRDLVLVAEVFRGGGEDLLELERHSMVVGALARVVAGPAGADHASMAGMLHDLGQLVLQGAWPEAAAADALAARAGGPRLHELEQARLGTSHAEVGGYLLGLWGLPWDIVEAVAHHHAPQRVAPGQPGPLTAVAVADALVRELEGQPLAPGLLQHLAGLQLPPGTLDGWRERARALPPAH